MRWPGIDVRTVTSITVAVAGLSTVVTCVDSLTITGVDSSIVTGRNSTIIAGIHPGITVCGPISPGVTRIDTGIVNCIFTGIGPAGPSRTPRNQQGPGQDQDWYWLIE
jgi:hypothetical protein